MPHQSLDTNVVLRILLQDIPEQHAAALRLLRRRLTRYFVSDMVFFETAYTLEKYYGLARSQINEMIIALLRLKNIDCNRELINATCEHFVVHKSLSFADCYLAAQASFMNATPLWTFDQALAKKVPDAKLVA